ncbi:uncharacterized protein N7487_000871 [Penicillium crustosum]|uniref:uncharacterized protein n=1 Tax=Penicillium crustosum TaxID=36656 RepID=UPI00238B2320|nr:uncharacterized protein N7487_000871 [Penicillium crustosum]KAJ5417321.1 hypothetical protein N7487_000871 [Penicillium crustosum]
MPRRAKYPDVHFSLIERVILSAGAMLIFSGDISIRSVHYNLTFWQNYTAYCISPVCCSQYCILASLSELGTYNTLNYSLGANDRVARRSQ